MASDSTASTAAASLPQDEKWSAQQYEDALAHLERLSEQLDGLRAALPSLVSPLLQPNTTKPQIFAQIKKAASQSNDQLSTFRQDWTSEQTQQLLSQSQESMKKDGDLSKGSKVARYGWSPQ